jgi:phosphoglycolate phosphatase-like HAD superfamily hydrolase
MALERLSLPPAETAYVGDSPEDVAMAKAAGAFAVGIPGGFPNREALAASRPDVLAPSLAAALRALLP